MPQSYQQQSNTLSYAAITTEEEVDNIRDFSFITNPYQEVILLLEFYDLKWKDDVWKLIHRYLDTALYAATSYKNRTHYENILRTIGSRDIQHYNLGSNKQVYNFSKVIIKHFITAENWGIIRMLFSDFSFIKMIIISILDFSRYALLCISQNYLIGYINGRINMVLRLTFYVNPIKDYIKNGLKFLKY